ncbi:hypothetical protein CC1G_14276 [Coprinopsis cinerea okayama7|uniref:Uncharacterized protein n=1 Tax=Coprinopsis cinerea (strain Okayama-7 / 130 / ATCC MYA-4618 / FGSC 9003) TaxID=240176 RepID=D6RLR9_COPC7|nr:hypothetical protein CC1G_14276 [Coprinopsis cinerea okayama7\|eukprot:XP_002911746.1 hypothetical protein CC1G_14276 [Coprinopsis cinerea okayama7\
MYQRYRMVLQTATAWAREQRKPMMSGINFDGEGGGRESYSRRVLNDSQQTLCVYYWRRNVDVAFLKYGDSELLGPSLVCLYVGRLGIDVALVSVGLVRAFHTVYIQLGKCLSRLWFKAQVSGRPLETLKTASISSITGASWSGFLCVK